MDVASLVAQIHATPTMAVLVVTGGGTQALADLLAVPGASRTVLEALIPYSAKSLAEFLGTSPSQAVSTATAKELAQAAYQRALQLRENNTIPVVGVACTAALVTDRPKKGEHRAYIGLTHHSATQVVSLTLEKGARDRTAEERVVSNVMLYTLAQGCGLAIAKSFSLSLKDRLCFLGSAVPQD